MDIQAYISSGIIERYSLGICSKEESSELEALALAHPEIRKEVEEIRSSLEAYAVKHAKTPPTGIKSKVMEAIQNSDQSQVIPLSTKTQTGIVPVSSITYAAAAVLILLLGSSFLNYVFYQKWKSSEKELAQAYSDKNFVASRLEIQKASYTKALKDLTILQNPEIVRMEMKGAVPAPDAKALVYCNFKTNEIFLDIKKLPAPPDSMQYQFWAIVKGKPVNGGMIDLCTTTDTCRMHQMNSIPEAHAFAISLEKKGETLNPKDKSTRSSGFNIL